MTSEARLTLSGFVAFLRNECKKEVESHDIRLSCDHPKIEAYERIGNMIDTFLEKYSSQKSMTKKAETNWYKSIEDARRAGFDNPDDLIRHIQKIASRQAFFDCEGISLAAINAFCSDYINKGETK